MAGRIAAFARHADAGIARFLVGAHHHITFGIAGKPRFGLRQVQPAFGADCRQRIDVS